MRNLLLAFVMMGLAILYFTGNVQADESLLLYFPFDEGGGDEAIDSSEYGNNGIAVPAGDWVDGKFGGAIQVTNAAGHIELTPSDSLNGDILVGEFTLAAYINPALSDTWGHIWRSRPTASGHNTLFVNAGGFLSWRGMVGGAWTVLCEGAGGDVVANEWQHVAIVSDEGMFRMYVNGELVAESPFATTDGGIATFYVGGDGQSENYTGAIDEFAIWNRPLGEDEIKAIATDGVGMFLTVEFADILPTTWGSLKDY
jgi:hypothetical protein